MQQYLLFSPPPQHESGAIKMSNVKSISAAIEEVFARQDRALASLQSKLLAISRTQKSTQPSYSLSKDSSPTKVEGSAANSPTALQRDKPVVVSVPSINAPSVPIDHAGGNMSPVIVRPNTSKVLQAVAKKPTAPHQTPTGVSGANRESANTAQRQPSLQQRRSVSIQHKTPSPKNAKSTAVAITEVTPSKGINKRLYGVGSRLQAMAADVIQEVKRRGSLHLPSAQGKDEMRSRPPPVPNNTSSAPASAGGKYLAERRHHHHHQPSTTVSKWDMSQRLKELEDIRASNTQALERTASGFSRTHSRVKVEASPPKDSTLLAAPTAGREARMADIDRMKDAAAQIAVTHHRKASVGNSVGGGGPKRISTNRVAAKSPRVFVQRLADGMIEHYSARGSRRHEEVEAAEREVSPLHSDEIHVDPNNGDDVRRRAAQPTLRPLLPLGGRPATQPKVTTVKVAARAALTQLGSSASKPPWSSTTKVVDLRPQGPQGALKKGHTVPK